MQVSKEKLLWGADSNHIHIRMETNWFVLSHHSQKLKRVDGETT
jgi:hypothetical protein